MVKDKQIDIADSDEDENLTDSPEEQGEVGPGGSTEGLESDDDVEDRAATMGLYTKPHSETSENMAPVGIADQVNQAEQKRRGIDEDTFSDD